MDAEERLNARLVLQALLRALVEQAEEPAPKWPVPGTHPYFVDY